MAEHRRHLRFTGTIRSGRSSWYRSLDLSVHDGAVSVVSDPLLDGLFVAAIESRNLAVLAFVLRLYVVMENQEAALRADPEVARRRQDRRERAREARPLSQCPECNTSGEIEMRDRLVPCPRCLGQGWIR